jgi:hypothetical protein
LTGRLFLCASSSLVEHWLFTQLPRDGAASTLPRLAGLRNGFLVGVCWVSTLLGPEETGAPVFAGRGSRGLGIAAGPAVRVDARGAGLVPSVA